ncbi:MAG: recombinase family protein [Epulopiscium sp.]|nr:recombinase family protein [Candidatus Epulonipiscium sp.]
MKKRKSIKNVLMYRRVSTDLQVDGFSLDSQKDLIEKECTHRNYTILEDFCDAGISGKSITSRNELKSLMRYIKANHGLVDAVITYKLSRLSRKMTDLVQIIQFFEDHEVYLISLEDNIDTSTEMGKTLMFLTGVFAEIEGSNIVSQARDGMAEVARQGYWQGGTPPIGYNLGDDKILQINIDEAKTVKLIFNLYTNKGWGYSRIVKHLNENGIRTKRGNTWAYSTVKQILDNPTYNGKIRWGYHQSWNKKRRKGKCKDENDYVLADGKHIAIIDDELWARTRKRREEVTRQPIKLTNLQWMLSGLAKCPECNSGMTANHAFRINKDGTRKDYRYYACNRWANTKLCKPNSIKADILEEQVKQEISKFINNKNLIIELEKRFNQDNNTSDIEKAINIKEKALNSFEKEVEKLFDLYANDEEETFVKNVFDKKIHQINADATRLKEELLQLNKKLNAIKETKLTYEKISVMLKNFDILINKATPEQQKDLFHLLIKEIKIENHKDINKRRASKIILHFTEEDIIKLTQGEDKSVSLTCGTVHLL